MALVPPVAFSGVQVPPRSVIVDFGVIRHLGVPVRVADVPHSYLLLLRTFHVIIYYLLELGPFFTLMMAEVLCFL